MKIYTKTGDDGTTALFDGSRVSKNNLRVDAYGDVDELNASIGCAVSFLENEDVKKVLYQIQNDLFALGANLANPKHKKQKEKANFSENKITFLEKTIDQFEASMQPLTSFILPGGSKVSSQLHLARCVCRRAERKMVTLCLKENCDELLIKYINRLSDFLFVCARYINHLLKIKDIPWKE